MARTISGTELAKRVKAEIFARSQDFQAKYGRHPGLGVVLVGDDPASKKYVAGKESDCQVCDIRSLTVRLPADVRESVLLDTVRDLNLNNEIDGVLVQMPLPPHIDARKVTAAIDVGKDVDCFHPENAGKLWTGGGRFAPCTPLGVLAMLDDTLGSSWCRGKHAVVIGRSNNVGRPMAELLLRRDMTVTVCHSATQQLWLHTKTADLVVSAAGFPGLLTEGHIKPGAVVVDVSMNRGADGKLCGDCDPTVAEVAGYVTPVPGGVGPMTRAMLMKNVMTAAETAMASYD